MAYSNTRLRLYLKTSVQNLRCPVCTFLWFQWIHHFNLWDCNSQFNGHLHSRSKSSGSILRIVRFRSMRKIYEKRQFKTQFNIRSQKDNNYKAKDKRKAWIVRLIYLKTFAIRMQHAWNFQINRWIFKKMRVENEVIIFWL